MSFSSALLPSSTSQPGTTPPPSPPTVDSAQQCDHDWVATPCDRILCTAVRCAVPGCGRILQCRCPPQRRSGADLVEGFHQVGLDDTDSPGPHQLPSSPTIDPSEAGESVYWENTRPAGRSSLGRLTLALPSRQRDQVYQQSTRQNCLTGGRSSLLELATARAASVSAWFVIWAGERTAQSWSGRTWRPAACLPMLPWLGCTSWTLPFAHPSVRPALVARAGYCQSQCCRLLPQAATYS